MTLPLTPAPEENKQKCAVFQVSVAVASRPSHVPNVSRRTFVVVHRRFGTLYLSFLQRSNMTIRDGTDQLSRHVGNHQPTPRNTPENESVEVKSAYEGGTGFVVQCA